MMKRIIVVFFTILCIGVQAQKVGVSLSGGGALGYAHIGFLQAMDEAGIQPSCISGTSMGAIIGMMYAAGYTPAEIKTLVHEEKMDRILRLFRLDFRRNGGLMGTEHIQKILLKYVPHNSFDSLKIKFYCCSSDMNHLTPHYQCSGGRLMEYVMSSAAIPGIFAPVVIDSIYYFDGGFHDNLPVKPLMDEQCDVRIGSYLLLEKPEDVRSLKKLWLHAYHYSAFATAQNSLPRLTDVITINPQSYWIDDFKNLDELYEIGYRAGKEYFDKMGKKE